MPEPGASSPPRRSGRATRAGAALIADADGTLIGFFSHGDLNRLLSRGERPGRHVLADVMTRDPKCVTVGQRVAEALQLMQRYRIDEIPVVDEQRKAVGMIDIQDLLAAGWPGLHPLSRDR